MELNNKIIWITGASSGIGKSLAIELSKSNTKLILSARNVDRLLEVKHACSTPKKVQVLPFNLEDYLLYSTIVESAVSIFGKIDILINNGGISQRASAIDTKIEVDKKLMDVNYFGTMALSKALLPYFIKQQSGHFVVVTSIVGKVATPVRSSYSASKHALHGFFDSLRAEIYKHNIHVTLVLPGYVRTQLSINALIGDGSKQNKMDATTNNGIPPDLFAKKMIKAIEKNRREVVIGGLKETSSIYLKRIWPGLLAKLVRKVNVT